MFCSYFSCLRALVSLHVGRTKKKTLRFHNWDCPLFRQMKKSWWEQITTSSFRLLKFSYMSLPHLFIATFFFCFFFSFFQFDIVPHITTWIALIFHSHAWALHRFSTSKVKRLCLSHFLQNVGKVFDAFLCVGFGDDISSTVWRQWEGLGKNGILFCLIKLSVFFDKRLLKSCFHQTLLKSCNVKWNSLDLLCALLFGHSTI